LPQGLDKSPEVWYNIDVPKRGGKEMSKSNEHKKDFREDKFARAYYCQHARLNQLREDKKQSRRKTRRKNKKLLENHLTNE
jgi:hypothetical protein